MNIKFRRRVFYSIGGILILLIILTTCDFLNPDDDFEPTGTPYTFNSNIELIRIQASRTRYNPAGAFSLDFICRSNSQNTETAILSAGLFFLAQNDKVQNTILVKDFSISVGAQPDTFTIGVFSVNEPKTLPGDSDFYTIGPINDHPDLNRVINIVKNKKLDASNVTTVQTAIYQITNGDTLSQETWQSLENLPPDTVPTLLAKTFRR